jgi:hypothetical protein
MARGPLRLRLNLHPRLRRTWHVATAAREARRRNLRDGIGGAAVLLLLGFTWLLAGGAGLDRIAALAMGLGLVFAGLGRWRRPTRWTPLLAPAGLLLLVLGGSREVLLERAPATCQAAYDAAPSGVARAGVLAREPYPDARRWLIWIGRRSICADFIGVITGNLENASPVSPRSFPSG